MNNFACSSGAITEQKNRTLGWISTQFSCLRRLMFDNSSNDLMKCFDSLDDDCNCPKRNNNRNGRQQTAAMKFDAVFCENWAFFTCGNFWASGSCILFDSLSFRLNFASMCMFKCIWSSLRCGCLTIQRKLITQKNVQGHEDDDGINFEFKQENVC